MATLALTFGSILAAALWELLRPRRQLEFPALRRRLANLAVWLFNIIFAALIFARPDTLREPWAWPSFSFIVGFLFLDLLSYGIHRCQHAVPLLWRLHALHHSDPDVDVTTSVRHHPIEFFIATGMFWLAVLVLGIPGPVVAVHSMTVFALAVATHANVRWPAWAERLLRPAIITVDLHRVHHSVDEGHLNTNFGAVFSFWDRLLGTLHPPVEVERFGVGDLPAEHCLGLVDQLATPWRLRRSSPAWQSPADLARREIEEHRLRYWRMW
jgi:sterol desaturase/sphingolipid hydroxylase (fatty acid hydroxylase superfamily)